MFGIDASDSRPVEVKGRVGRVATAPLPPHSAPYNSALHADLPIDPADPIYCACCPKQR
jgi:hypothetical protein